NSIVSISDTDIEVLKTSIRNYQLKKKKDHKMSQTTYCANCGKEISITARFCRFCGSPIRRGQVESPAPPVARRKESVQTPSPEPTRFVQDDAIEKIPSSVVDSLYARKRKKQINNEMKSLLKDIDELGKKLEIGLIDDTQSNNQTLKLQEKIDSLQKEKETLKPEPLEIEKFIESEKKWFARLEKIEEKNKAGSVSRAVYDSLKDEYSSELATTQRKRATEERKVRRWLVDLQKEVRILETKIESLKVRSDIEGQNQEETNQTLVKLSDQRVRKATAAEVLLEILETL
ncbi:MAG: zinc-ribbon domain-containing protein, partial [Candidatus Hodarchaeales archaeon]